MTCKKRNKAGFSGTTTLGHKTSVFGAAELLLQPDGTRKEGRCLLVGPFGPEASCRGLGISQVKPWSFAKHVPPFLTAISAGTSTRKFTKFLWQRRQCKNPMVRAGGWVGGESVHAGTRNHLSLWGFPQFYSSCRVKTQHFPFRLFGEFSLVWLV